jgi:hypothetical protein
MTAEQATQPGLTIVEAAVRLGISPDAVRMRFKRQKLRGYKRGGRIFIVLNSGLNKTEQEPEQIEHLTEQPVQSGDDGWAKLAEHLQAENERLNRRLDDVLDQLKREQVLRQEDQAERREMRLQLAVLSERLALPAPAEPKDDTALRTFGQAILTLLKRR